MLWTRYQENRTYFRRAGHGWTIKTNLLDDQYIVHSCLRERTASDRELKNTLRNVTNVETCAQTVRRKLKEANLVFQRPVKALD